MIRSRLASSGLAVLALFVASSIAAAQPEPSPFAGHQTLHREALVARVIERNPSIAAARHGWEAAQARVSQAGALEDPMLSYSVAPLSVGGRFGQVLELGQSLPFPGKLGLREDIARAEAAAARQDVERTRLELALIASKLFDDYAVAHRALAINDEHLDLLATLKKSAEAQYVAGRASQQDPLQAEVELSHLLHQKVVLETHRATIRAQLNGLLHLPPESPLPPPPSEVHLPPLELPTSSELQEQALKLRPELESLRSHIDGREAAVRLAQRDYWPDLRVMGSYNSMWMETPHQFMAGVALNIPLQLGKRRAAVDEARAELHRVRSDNERLADEIRVAVEQARERVEEASHVVELYRDRVLPAAKDQVAASRAGFESGRNSFLAVIEAHRNLRTVQLRFEEALADVHRRRAELMRAVGRIPLLSEGEL